MEQHQEEIAKVTVVKDKTTEELVKELEADGGVVEQVDPLETIKEYLSDPDVSANLDEVAIHFSESSKNKWVSARELQKRSRVKKPEELYQLLDLLVLSKRALSKKTGDIILYRFTLNKDQRSKILTRYISELRKQLQALEEELASLKEG